MPEDPPHRTRDAVDGVPIVALLDSRSYTVRDVRFQEFGREAVRGLPDGGQLRENLVTTPLLSKHALDARDLSADPMEPVSEAAERLPVDAERMHPASV